MLQARKEAQSGGARDEHPSDPSQLGRQAWGSPKLAESNCAVGGRFSPEAHVARHRVGQPEMVGDRGSGRPVAQPSTKQVIGSKSSSQLGHYAPLFGRQGWNDAL